MSLSAARSPLNEVEFHAHSRGVKASLDWYMALLSIVVLLSIPFIVGDQPQGAESLNPVDRLETVAPHGDATKQAILLLVYGMFAVLLLRRERLRALQFLGTPLILLLCWTFASPMWSV
jgi:hypothetical protein